MCMSVQHMFCIYRGRKRMMLGPLELELYMAMSHHVGAEVQTQVVWESSCWHPAAEPSLHPSLYFLICLFPQFIFMFSVFKKNTKLCLSRQLDWLLAANERLIRIMTFCLRLPRFQTSGLLIIATVLCLCFFPAAFFKSSHPIKRTSLCEENSLVGY